MVPQTGERSLNLWGAIWNYNYLGGDRYDVSMSLLGPDVIKFILKSLKPWKPWYHKAFFLLVLGEPRYLMAFGAAVVD